MTSMTAFRVVPLVAFAAFGLLLPRAGWAGTGGLDPSFGTGGVVNVPGYSLAVQTDGKIVALGAAAIIHPVFGQYSANLQLTRLTAAGGIDFSRSDPIGSCGFCSAALAQPGATLVQGDGSILTVSTFQTSSLNTGACKEISFYVRRHVASGSPDSSFGSAGLATIGGGFAKAVAVQADGKPVVAGSKTNYGCMSPDRPDDHSVARLTSSGARDASFGNMGLVVSPLGTGGDAANAVAIRPDGKIVTAGFASNGTTNDFTIAIYDTNGTLESSSLIDLGPGGDDVAYALALQPDGKMILGGSLGSNSALARLTPAGAYDSAFAQGGRLALPGGAVRAVALQPDGKILAATEDGDVLRFDATGALDMSFGVAGRVTTPLANLLSMALQADGRIVVGNATSIARIDPDATLPLTPVPALVDFLGQSLNTTAPAQQVTITNTSGSAQTITTVTASTGFAATHDCTSLSAGASCTATVRYTPVVEGPNAGYLTVTGSVGTVKVLLFGTGERSLVTHYYRSILRRAPDAGGKAFWESEATRMSGLGANVNETWYAMAVYFFTSPEYLGFGRDDTGFVTDLYNTFFNRPPDGGGLAYWTGQIASGMPREVVLVSFMLSDEFVTFTQAIFGNTAARREVDTVMDFYRGLLSRLPDSGGLNYWVGQFRTAQCQGPGAVYAQVESISSNFLYGGEYAARNRTHPQYVGDLYNAFLRRGGDLGGVQFWIDQLATGGMTREFVRQQFIASPEFQTRVSAIIAQGCLP